MCWKHQVFCLDGICSGDSWQILVKTRKKDERMKNKTGQGHGHVWNNAEPQITNISKTMDKTSRNFYSLKPHGITINDWKMLYTSFLLRYKQCGIFSPTFTWFSYDSLRYKCMNLKIPELHRLLSVRWINIQTLPKIHCIHLNSIRRWGLEVNPYLFLWL